MVYLVQAVRRNRSCTCSAESGIAEVQSALAGEETNSMSWKETRIAETRASRAQKMTAQLMEFDMTDAIEDRQESVHKSLHLLL